MTHLGLWIQFCLVIILTWLITILSWELGNIWVLIAIVFGYIAFRYYTDNKVDLSCQVRYITPGDINHV